MISGVKPYYNGWGAGVVMYRVRAWRSGANFTADHPPTTKSTPPGPASGTRTAAVGGILGSAVVVAEWGEIIRALPAASMPVRLPAIQRPVLGMRQMLSRHEGRSAPRPSRGCASRRALWPVPPRRRQAPPRGTRPTSSLHEERSAPRSRCGCGCPPAPRVVHPPRQTPIPGMRRTSLRHEERSAPRPMCDCASRRVWPPARLPRPRRPP